MYQQNVAEALLYIPNVLVSANVEVDNLVQSREQERKYDAKAFPYKNLEQTDSETTSETGPGSEPGMTANQPRAVRQQAGIKNQRTVEKSTNSSESVPVSTRIAQREIAGFTPKSVQVAVAIPKDFYRSILLKQGVDEADKAAFEAKLAQVRMEQEKIVKEKIAKLIPVPAGGTSADAINVSSYDRLETAEAPAAVSMTTRIGEIVTQWGGPAGLALFAMWALWMLNRSTKRLPSASTPAAGKTTAGRPAAAPAAAPPEEEELPREPTRRDKLQVLVKDNPEMAAAVLSRWLSPPK
jgi:flagellar M-ring protein FliF